MPPRRLTVVISRQLPAGVEARLTDLFDAELRACDSAMTRAELIAAVERADVLVTTITDRIDAGILARAGPRLKLIAQFGAGVDNLDVATARQRGILVTHTPGTTVDDTADMTLALILAVTRRIPEGLAAMQAGAWHGWSPTAFLGGRIAGRRLGILGMGRIGTAVARRARAFGMAVHYHNRTPAPEQVTGPLGAVWHDSLDHMISRVDVISVNCPHTPATFHLMNARRIALMKPGAVIVNTSRGEVIDENALVRALEAGAIAGAGLDVFEHGTPLNPRLRSLPNVVLLPHMGSATREGRREMGEKVLLNIKTFADGHRPPDLVVPFRG
ncbi:D-glycerate dehydrogenase [Palleronia sediminis]|uniref:D-glycerate dehydrogenase n=1 Tax=Palleronia sediminis TaxID=2547833 RepID=A0A4R6A259_9RHOB|nr:D-glycerate dehydrogenase [Palleronia sediminis]TDL75096.1 D-glycerate dehydrogenase [Palleronia sediminis]